jgi:hypothetical protein
MIKNIVIAVTAASMMVGVAHSKIEIKGYKTGEAWTHTNEYILKDSKYMSLGDLTIADHLVKSVFLQSTVDRKKTASIRFTLNSSDYFSVKAAIASKFNIKCKQYTLQNKMGAKFTQEVCHYIEGGDILILERYEPTNIREMNINIHDVKDIDQRGQALKAKRKKDL